MKLFVRDKSFYLKLITFGLPIALQQLITVGVNIADNIMIGQLGETLMSSVTLSNNFMSIYQIMCMGLGMGASVLTSRFFGMQDETNLKKTVNLMFRLEFIIATFFALATAFFPGQILGLFTNEEDVILAGIGYLLISVPCFYLNGYALTTSIVLRSVGKGVIPLASSIVSFFVNIFFNWVFIFGNLGAPKMGVKGAALGTLIARVFEFVIILGYLFFKEENIKLRFKDLLMSVKSLIGEYVRISIPVLISDTLLGLGNSAVAVVMGHIGATFVAANSIVTVTMQLSTVVIQGISQASCAITGITIGEGDIKKAKEQGVTFAVLGFLFGIIGCGIILLLSNPIISTYKIEPATKALANELMDALAIVVLFQSANSILTKGVLRGGGDTKFLMYADILFLWVCSIPLGAIAGLVFHWSGFMIFIMLKLDQFIKAVWCLFRLKSGKWIKKVGNS